MSSKTDEKKIPCGAREKMPLWFSLAWSSRGVSAALNVILVAYVSFYASDVLGLNVGIVGAMLLMSKVVDAFTDLGVGFIIDRTHTKWGKARPYEFFIILEWIFTFMLFTTPDIGKTGQYIWIFLMYVLINAICTTALGGADAVYMARTFSTDNNRIKAMSVNGVVVMLCSIIFNIVAPQFINSAGTSKSGWSHLALYMAVPLAVIGILRFVLCKEIETEQKEEKEGKDSDSTGKTGFKETIGALLKNKYLFLLVCMMFITNIINNLGPAATYYFKYMMGDVGALSIANLTALITPVMLIIFPVLSRKIGTTKILQYAMVFGIVGMVIRTAGGTNMATILLGGGIASIAVLPISMMINTYIIDCMDYGEWKTGIRVEGMVASVTNFAGKVGAGAASGLLGLVMGLAGYDGSLAVQSSTANMAIVGIYNIFPLVLYVIMLLLALMYRMDKIRPQIKADLEKKHGKNI